MMDEQTEVKNAMLGRVSGFFDAMENYMSSDKNPFHRSLFHRRLAETNLDYAAKLAHVYTALQLERIANALEAK